MRMRMSFFCPIQMSWSILYSSALISITAFPQRDVTSSTPPCSDPGSRDAVLLVECRILDHIAGVAGKDAGYCQIRAS